MATIRWDDKYRSGDTMVDNQHMELFRLVNNLHEAIVQGRGKEVITPTLQELANYVVEHFRCEEAFMAKAQYPEFQNHKRIHDALTQKALDLIQGFKSGKLVLTITLSQFLGDWLRTHICQEDQKMVAWVKSRAGA